MAGSSRSKRNTPRIGDVYEFQTPRGLAYIQFTHLTPEDKFPLIRVLPGTFQSRPADISSVVNQQELYFTFYVLPYALRAKQIVLVSNETVPSWAREFPLIRKRWGAGVNGRFSWLIGPASVSGTLEGLGSMLHVRELTAEQRKLSLDQMCSHPALVDKIVRGWTPERDDELTAMALAEEQARASSVATTAPKDSGVDHYLYFARKSDAQEVAKRLRRKGWVVEIRLGGDGRNWLALAKQPASMPGDAAAISKEMESLAEELHGEYDGSGSAV